MEEKEKIPEDEMFTIQVSENMELRNRLRAGLVEAQGRDTEKIPMFVSWPGWLEDGIVCLYARDFQYVLRRAIHDTARALCSSGGDAAADASAGNGTGGEDEQFRALDHESLERIETPHEREKDGMDRNSDIQE